MLLYSWDGGLDVCVDLTGSSPLTQTGMFDFSPGRAVTDAAQRKRGKYMTKCADIGYGFLPFLFSSFRELKKDAVTLLKRVRNFSMAQDIGARAASHIFNRIGFSIAKGVGAQIVSRFPSNVLVAVCDPLYNSDFPYFKESALQSSSPDPSPPTHQHQTINLKSMSNNNNKKAEPPVDRWFDLTLGSSSQDNPSSKFCTLP
ncbi:hypothetical protein Tco_0049364, partial [Tanacetum coccineum]